MTTPSCLETHLGYWLRFVSNHVSHAFKLKVEAVGVTVAEWVVLRALFDVDFVRPSELSERVGLTRGAISKLVDRLYEKKLVTRKADKIDRRSQMVGLSSAGRKIVPVLAALADANDSEFFGKLSKSERETLGSLLERLAIQHELKGVAID